MKAIICLGALALAGLGSGCANNTQRGAATGAAAGAVLGGIIGNNASHGNTEKGAAIGAVAGAIAGGAIGNKMDNREEVRYDVNRQYVVQTIPPLPSSTPRETIPPQPSGGYVWIPGHYSFNGTGYSWMAGRWEMPPMMG